MSCLLPCDIWSFDTDWSQAQNMEVVTNSNKVKYRDGDQH